MRRRLIVMALAVTSMVVLAFVIPLAILVRDLAADRALTEAEREAESLARFLAVLGLDQAVAASVGSEFDVSIVMPDGTVVGAVVPEDEDLDAAREGSAFRAPVPGGQVVYVPVLQSDGVTVVVRVFVAEEVLAEGVAVSWLTLGLLGVALVGIAVAVSDRMARSLVAPVRELQATAIELGEGNLDARVVPSGPEEIEDVGVEFNRLAERIEHLLQQERETAADLSHRLRTPLTAVRLDAEAMAEGEQRQRLLEDLDELERHVDFVIREARREVRNLPGAASDLAAIVASRVAFWGALAEEQGRLVSIATVPHLVRVAVPEADVVAMVDALIGNVFSHTDDGVGFAVELTATKAAALLRVEDGGPGFPDDSVLERGRGHGTGLGLDIARRTAESAGGTLVIGRSPLGGAAVMVTIPRLS
jgi:signal transduction histidine kinase